MALMKEQIEQWNRTESTPINLHKYTELAFDNGVKVIQWRKSSLLNKQCWNNWIATCRKINLGRDLTTYTKINLKRTTDLKVKYKIIKLLGKKQENICMVWVWFDDSILDVIPKAQSIEKNINKLDFAKIRNGLCERHY